VNTKQYKANHTPLRTVPNTKIGDVINAALINGTALDFRVAIDTKIFQPDEGWAKPQVFATHKEQYIREALEVPFLNGGLDAAHIRVRLGSFGNLLTGFTFHTLADLRTSVVFPEYYAHFEDYFEFKTNVTQEFATVACVAEKFAESYQDVDGGDGSLLSKFKNVPEVKNAVLNMVTFIITAVVREHHTALVLYAHDLKVEISKHIPVCVERLERLMSAQMDPKTLHDSIGAELRNVVSVIGFVDLMRKRYGMNYSVFKCGESAYDRKMLNYLCHIEPNVLQHQLVPTWEPTNAVISEGVESPTCIFPQRCVTIPIFEEGCTVVGKLDEGENDPDYRVYGINERVALTSVIYGSNAKKYPPPEIRELEDSTQCALFHQMSRFIPMNLFTGASCMFKLIPNPDPDMVEDGDDTGQDIDIVLEKCDAAMKNRSGVGTVLDLLSTATYLAGCQIAVGDVRYGENIMFTYPQTIVVLMNYADYVDVVSSKARSISNIHLNSVQLQAFFESSLYRGNSEKRFLPTKINGRDMLIGVEDVGSDYKNVGFTTYSTLREAVNSHYYDRPGNAKSGIKRIKSENSVEYFCELMYRDLVAEYIVPIGGSLYSTLVGCICSGECEVEDVVVSIERAFSRACAVMMGSHKFSCSVRDSSVGGCILYLNNEALYKL